jgi:hypothetical protein
VLWFSGKQLRYYPHGSIPTIANDGDELTFQPGEVMKVYIQNRKSHNLVRSSAEDWTNRVDEALAFTSGTGAVLYCVQNELSDCQFLMRFNGEHEDIVIPALSAGARNQQVESSLSVEHSLSN